MLTKTDELENFAILEIYEKPALVNALVQECKKQQVFLDQITIPGKELAAFAKIAPVERFSVLVDIKKLIARSKKNAEAEKIKAEQQQSRQSGNEGAAKKKPERRLIHRQSPAYSPDRAPSAGIGAGRDCLPASPAGGGYGR